MGQVLNGARRLRWALARNLGVSNASLLSRVGWVAVCVCVGFVVIVQGQQPSHICNGTQVPLPLASHHGVQVDGRADGRRDQRDVRRVPTGRLPVLEGSPIIPPSPSPVRSMHVFFPEIGLRAQGDITSVPGGKAAFWCAAVVGRVGPLCTTLHYVWCTTMQPRMAERGFPVLCYPRVAARMRMHAACLPPLVLPLSAFPVKRLRVELARHFRNTWAAPPLKRRTNQTAQTIALALQRQCPFP
jgi:hypothetical protein